MESRGPREVRRARDRDPAVQVVDDDAGDPREDHDARQEGHHGLQHRQDEHVEGHVQAELRVGGAEGVGVDGQQRLLPMRRELPCRAQQRQYRGHDPGQRAAHGLHRGAVGLEIAGRLVVRKADLARAVGPGHGGEHGAEHDEEADDEHDAGGDPLGPHHACEAELVEPEHLGPGARQEDDDRRQHGENPQRPGQWARATRASRVSGSGSRGAPGPSRTGRAPSTGGASAASIASRASCAEGGGSAEEDGRRIEAARRAPAVLIGSLVGRRVRGGVPGRGPRGSAAGVPAGSTGLIRLEEAATDAILPAGRGGLVGRRALGLVVGIVVGPGAHGHAPCRSRCARTRADGLRRRGRRTRPSSHRSRRAHKTRSGLAP